MVILEWKEMAQVSPQPWGCYFLRWDGPCRKLLFPGGQDFYHQDLLESKVFYKVLIAVGTSHLPRDVSLAEPSKVPAGHAMRDGPPFSSPTPSHSPTALPCVSLSACVCLRTSKGYRACFVWFRWTLRGVRICTEAPKGDQYVLHQSSACLQCHWKTTSPEGVPWWEGAKVGVFCIGTAKA